MYHKPTTPEPWWPLKFKRLRARTIPKFRAWLKGHPVYNFADRYPSSNIYLQPRSGFYQVHDPMPCFLPCEMLELRTHLIYSAQNPGEFRVASPYHIPGHSDVE